MKEYIGQATSENCRSNILNSNFKRTNSSSGNRPNKKHANSNLISKRATKPPKCRPNEDIWFDGVSPALIAASREDQSASTQSLIKPSSFAGPTRRIAIDCEFVGVGYEGKENALARVSIVNQFGHVLLDTLVRPKERVTDYRTAYSGIRPGDLRPGGPARPFHVVHQEVAKLCKGRVLVGHSIGNDLKVLMLSHPRRDIRDTARYRPFRALFSGRTPSLRKLTERVLGVQVQSAEHDSIEDARAAMRLYTSVKRVWESRKRGGHGGQTVFNNPFANPVHSVESSVEHIAMAGQPNTLSEFESCIPVLESSTVTQSNGPTLRPHARSSWDTGRHRRCSKKRQKFVQKRRMRGVARFQSAQL